jgi:hypothetical protein
MTAKESAAPIKFAQASVVKALFVANNKAKEEVASIAGTYGDRVKTQVEVGNLHGPAFRQAAAIHRKSRSNELKAKEHLAHLKFYIEILEEEIENKGHTGDLDKMSKAGADEAEGKEDDEADLNKVPTGEGGVPLGDAQKQLEGAKAIAENRRAARKALDLPEDGSAAAPPAPPTPADQPKRGRKGKPAAEAPVTEAPAGPPVEAAPPPPPAPTLADDEEEDLRPEFLRRRERDRAAEKASVH